MTQLPISTPEVTPEVATGTATIPVPSVTATAQPTPPPGDAIRPERLGQVRLLHQYWSAVANAAGVDPYEMDISAVASSPDGQWIAVGGCSKRLEADLRSGNVYCNGEDPEEADGVPFLLILDADTEEVIGTVPENEARTTIADLAFTPDGQKLIYAVHPGKFAVWDIASGRLDATLLEADTSAPKVAVSPDGRWVALKTADRAQIWDSDTAEFVAEIPAYFRPQFSADGSRVSVYREREFLIYETGTWIELMRFGLPCDCVYALSPDFSLFATSERALPETPVVIWDTSTGDQVQTLQPGRDFTAFLEFSPDGQMLWRASNRGQMTAWDPRDGTRLADVIGGVTPIFSLEGFQFAGNGRYYLLVSDLLLGRYGLP